MKEIDPWVVIAKGAILNKCRNVQWKTVVNKNPLYPNGQFFKFVQLNYQNYKPV